ncbi:MAG: hypothetical protein R2801_01000 [Chitinophagales bacterium]
MESKQDTCILNIENNIKLYDYELTQSNIDLKNLAIGDTLHITYTPLSKIIISVDMK